MAHMFAFDANAPIARLSKKESGQEHFSLEWFKQELEKAGVSKLHIVWEKYKEEYTEVPAHVMRTYLHYRRRMLHKDALKCALKEA